MRAYAVGLWTVKEGRDDDFVQAWMELGDRLRSYGPNESLDALEGRRESIAAVARESDTLSERTQRLFGLLENLDLHTLDYVGEIS